SQTYIRPGSGKGGSKRTGISSKAAPCTHSAENQVIKCLKGKFIYMLTATRQPGQGGTADPPIRDLRAQLLQAEAAYFSRANRSSQNNTQQTERTLSVKRELETGPSGNGEVIEDDTDAKRRRILEETRQIDADSEGSGSDGSEEESDEEDETAELLRELEKIKKERAEQREREEREKAAEEQEKREHDIALGNPLLNPIKDFNVRRR
ncbi:MAG: hypothetical protein Q9187_008706, partial [Circinaria calcarea]